MTNPTSGPEISVIIPVYNIEKYLDKALKSLLYQTFKNIEIICVDDGSTDSSGDICERLARTDCRIKMIHQKNRGTGAARNAGIAAAAGKYISFVDGDDWLHPAFLETLYRLCEDNGCEIAQCGLTLVWSEKDIIDAEYCEAVIVSGKDMALRSFLPGDGWRQIIVCNKLYRRELLKNIKFPYGKKHEDEYFTHEVLWNASRVALTECPLYYYRQRSDSAMGIGFTVEKALDFIEAFENKTEFYRDKDRFLFYRANLTLAWHLNNYLQELQNYCPEREDIKILLRNKLQEVRASIKMSDSEEMRETDLDKLRMRNLNDRATRKFYLEKQYNKSNRYVSGLREEAAEPADPKVSVCISVYNGARILADCLDSVVKQTLTDIEIICVTGAGTDKSREILETYAAVDSRIKIVSRETGPGTLAARRHAAQAAQGKYIMFVDSDGELYPNACETAYKVIMQNQTDVAEFGVTVTEPSGKSSSPHFLPNADADRLEDRNILHLRMQGHLKNCKAWNKIYRAELCKRAFSEIDSACSAAAGDFRFFCAFGYYARSVSLIREDLYMWKSGYGLKSSMPSVVNPEEFKKILTEKDDLDAAVEYLGAKSDREAYQSFLKRIHNDFLHQVIIRWNDHLEEKDKTEGLRLLGGKWGSEATVRALQWLQDRLNRNSTMKDNPKRGTPKELMEPENIRAVLLILKLSGSGFTDTVRATVNSLFAQSYQLPWKLLIIDAGHVLQKEFLPEELAKHVGTKICIAQDNPLLRQNGREQYKDYIPVTLQAGVVYPKKWLHCLMTAYANHKDAFAVHSFNAPDKPEEVLLFNDYAIVEFGLDAAKDGKITVYKSKEIIVSITSYPARINTAVLAIRTMFRQTKQPDKVILWLGEEKFPNKSADLPKALLQWTEEKNLEIRWCEDIGPHTKYFHAFKEYPDALVITIDDDILYPPDRIENLYLCYLLFPHAVTAARADFVPVSEHGEMPPVTVWPEEVDAWVLQPSMQLYAMGVNSVLYPTVLFSSVAELLDKDTIRRICLYADDLWLKAMQVVAGIPVVVSEPDQPLPISTEESQKTALLLYNCVNGGNNRQWLGIQQEIDKRYGKGTFIQKLSDRSVGRDLTGSQALCDLARYFQRKAQKLKNQYAKYNTLRVDIRNTGGNCSVTERIITPKAFSARKPSWLSNGVTIECVSDRMKITVQCEGDGELAINLLGKDMRNASGIRYPIWIDVNYFSVNGEVIFNETKTVCHDKRYIYRKNVADGELLTLDLEWSECRSPVILDEYKQFQADLRNVGSKVRRLEKDRAETVKRLEKELKQVKNGWSFRIGRAITYVPRNLKKWFTH